MMNDDLQEYANKHIPDFRQVPLLREDEFADKLSVMTDGSQLTAAYLAKSSFTVPVLVKGSLPLGLKVPESLTVRGAGELVGMKTPLRVIDVYTQQELEGWHMADLVDYFENDERHMRSPVFSERKAAQQCVARTRPDVLNQISLEFSATDLREYVDSPQCVRDMDWIDHVWPADWRDRGYAPNVQYYCLTSGQGAYTDFHIDFGGTSVWYHILQGSKEFVLMAPTEKHLKAYDDWMGNPSQGDIFLPDTLVDGTGVFRVRLGKGETFMIPSGWIHAVYTPEDSLVFGGNFLHGLSIPMQLKIYESENRALVMEDYKVPFFEELHFYAAGYYYDRMKAMKVLPVELDGLRFLYQSLSSWISEWEENLSSESEKPTPYIAAHEVASRLNFTSFGDFLIAFRRLLEETSGRPVLHAVHGDKLSRAQKKGSKSPLREQGKTKLKISLAGRSPQAPASENGRFHIGVSSSSAKSVPVPSTMPRARSKPREQTSLLIDEDHILKDEEWTPSSESSHVREKRKNVLVQKARRQVKPKQTSAKQRLFKKLR